MQLIVYGKKRVISALVRLLQCRFSKEELVLGLPECFQFVASSVSIRCSFELVNASIQKDELEQGQLRSLSMQLIDDRSIFPVVFRKPAGKEKFYCDGTVVGKEKQESILQYKNYQMYPLIVEEDNDELGEAEELETWERRKYGIEEDLC